MIQVEWDRSASLEMRLHRCLISPDSSDLDLVCKYAAALVTSLSSPNHSQTSVLLKIKFLSPAVNTLCCDVHVNTWGQHNVVVGEMIISRYFNKEYLDMLYWVQHLPPRQSVCMIWMDAVKCVSEFHISAYAVHISSYFALRVVWHSSAFETLPVCMIVFIVALANTAVHHIEKYHTSSIMV